MNCYEAVLPENDCFAIVADRLASAIVDNREGIVTESAKPKVAIGKNCENFHFCCKNFLIFSDCRRLLHNFVTITFPLLATAEVRPR